MSIQGNGNMLIARAFLTTKQCLKQDLEEMIRSPTPIDLDAFFALIEKIEAMPD